MKELVFLLALGLIAPLSYAYDYWHPAPSGGNYHARKSHTSFAAWCVDFACTKDESYTYYNSIPFHNDREKCHCKCPTSENRELLYPVIMDYRLLENDAYLLHNGSISDLENYCPHAIYIGPELEMFAWNEAITILAKSRPFSWNPHVPCNWKTSTGKEGTAILTRAIVDTLKGFSVLIICLSDYKKLWMVHSLEQKKLDPGTEKYILKLLQKMNMDTSKVFRPDFSQCF